MKMTQTFEVSAPIEEVWAALLDIERIAPCLPGATITGHDEDGTYHGSFTVKLGPTTAAYRGTLKIGEVDETARRATLHARGTDKRGQGGATATIVNSVEAAEGGTRVTADTDFTITGRLARFGRGGMIEDISNRLLREFATCLQGKLATEQEAEVVAAAAAPESAAAGAAAAAAHGIRPAPQPRPATPPAKPVNALALFFGVLRERLARLFGRTGRRR